MVNPGILLKIKSLKEIFALNHPKFPLFLQAVNKEMLLEGSIIEIKVSRPDGKEMNSNVKLNASDIELVHNLEEILKQ